MNYRTITDQLDFPEGPIAMPDGSFVVVEIRRRTLSRVSATGEVSIIAELGGGPNGAAIGPDGYCYVCNNGGFEWATGDGGTRPIGQAVDYTGGRIDRVDLNTGEWDTLYSHGGDVRLKGPNDIVFDKEGGFWFTDLGKRRDEDMDIGGVFYATIDGTHCERVIHPLITPNGIGLSPTEDEVYVAETATGRVWSFEVTAPGRIAKQDFPSPNGGSLLAGVPGFQNFDSLAVDIEGNVCVATLMNGGITVISPDGRQVEHIPAPDIYTTNICFGGEGLKTAYLTLSGTGKLVSTDWPTAGLPLNFLNK